MDGTWEGGRRNCHLLAGGQVESGEREDAEKYWWIAEWTEAVESFSKS
jgi:hypothetical protein